MSQFAFLAAEFPAVHEHAAERLYDRMAPSRHGVDEEEGDKERW